MGPESAKTFPGQTLVETSGLTAGRAKLSGDMPNPAGDDTRNPATPA
jgi:hypothetical protein